MTGRPEAPPPPSARVVRRVESPIHAVIRPPGSKSLTNRYYVLAALAEGTSRIRRPLRADDTNRLLDALETLGAGVRWHGDDVVIDGVAGRFPRGGRVDLGDGGTPTRFVLAAATRAAQPVVIDGSPRMRERPIAEGVELLRRLGARIEYIEADERLPVRVDPSTLRGGRIEIGATRSSQFVSALMLLAPLLPGGLELVHTALPTSASYLALTRDALARFGVAASVMLPRAASPREGRSDAPGGSIAEQPLLAHDVDVEADASSAVYWLVLAAILPGSRITVEGLGTGSAQPDVRVLDALEAGGAEWSATIEPPTISVRGSDAHDPTAPIRPFEIDCAEMPDAALAIAALAARSSGRCRISGLATLRVKESDRVAALATELRRLGCTVGVDGDALEIDPTTAHDRPVVIETYRDHRIAMAFAILGCARGGISIADPGCVDKSYPGFWIELERVTGGSSGAP